MTRPNPRDRRSSLRFDKVFRVHLSSEDYGDISAVARNISLGGMLIETPAPLPLGSQLHVHFEIPDSHEWFSVRAEVKNQYAFNYADDGDLRSARGMGLRFLEFVEKDPDRLEHSLKSRSRSRTLH